MEDSTSLLKSGGAQPCTSACNEYDALHSLELKYWELRTTRKAVRYLSSFVLSAQLAAASFCFISSPWLDVPEDGQRRRLAGCLLLTTFSSACFLISIGAFIVALVTSCRARVGNALLFVGSHLQSLLYSSLACAVAAALLKCVGFLLFLVGTQKLLAALAAGSLPQGFFRFVGNSYLYWLAPLMLAALLAGILLLWHFLRILLAVCRGGYHLFCPPNPALHSLDALANDAVMGRPLSVSPRDPLSQASPALLSELVASELSPRRLGVAMTQQRRTLAPPVTALSGTAVKAEAPGEEPSASPRQESASAKGAWLVALWIRGPFLLAALGCFCVGLSLLLFALAADSGSPPVSSRGQGAFESLSHLLLPSQQPLLQHAEVDSLTAEKPQPPTGAPLARKLLHHQQTEGGAVMLQESRQHWKPNQEAHLSGVLQATEAPIVGAARNVGFHSETDAALKVGDSFLQARSQEPQSSRDQQQRQKSAAALLLLALGLLIPLLGNSLGEWVEDMFFAHMVMIKRNPWMLVPPPVLVIHSIKKTGPADSSGATTPRAQFSGPLVHMTQERIAHQGSQSFLGIGTQPAKEEDK
ncbi:uncharacterized protein LOC34621024 [Cyclospora cayetanensis]|uniref:Uncharacterized protein LOC34621024 n=1 Tax=Cyclospora cayetanensis TaxID=88456 RepID=A0A6P6S2J0_9EIME|nr:uncharacterized protein LOC34621024 [Cyclospora cayetanensis]